MLQLIHHQRRRIRPSRQSVRHSHHARNDVRRHQIRGHHSVFRRTTNVGVHHTPCRGILANQRGAIMIMPNDLRNTLNFIIRQGLTFATNNDLASTTLHFGRHTSQVLTITSRLNQAPGHHHGRFGAGRRSTRVRTFIRTFRRRPQVRLTHHFSNLLRIVSDPRVRHRTITLLTVRQFRRGAFIFVRGHRVIVTVTNRLLQQRVRSNDFRRFIHRTFILTRARTSNTNRITRQFTTARTTTAITRNRRPNINIVSLRISATPVHFLSSSPHMEVRFHFQPQTGRRQLVSTILTLSHRNQGITGARLNMGTFHLAIVIRRQRIRMARTTTRRIFSRIPRRRFTSTETQTV